MLETSEHTGQRIETVNRPFVSAIVLAAGMSNRMGSPKQLMKVGITKHIWIVEGLLGVEKITNKGA